MIGGGRRNSTEVGNLSERICEEKNPCHLTDKQSISIRRAKSNFHEDDIVKKNLDTDAGIQGYDE